MLRSSAFFPRWIKQRHSLRSLMSTKTSHEILTTTHPNSQLRAMRKNCVGKKQRTWKDSFRLLSEFKAIHGNCSVPYNAKCTPLLKWTRDQRQEQAQLTPKQRKLLDSIGFDWETRKERGKRRWEEMLQGLENYKQKHGDCLVPQVYAEDPPLGVWVATQRQLRKRKQMQKSREERLERIGFVWQTRGPRRKPGSVDRELWDRQFQKILKFKQKWGHCIVPTEYAEDPHLSRWVKTQRAAYKYNYMNPDLRERLNAIGFVWENLKNIDTSIAEKYWETMFERLLDYKEKQGDVVIPARYQEYGLGLWVKDQRQRYREGLMDPDRIKRLNAVGFVWGFNKTPWRVRFERLKEFKEQYGHCRVAADTYPDLSKWVVGQRNRHKKGLLSQTSFDKLESIGFEWKLTE